MYVCMDVRTHVRMCVCVLMYSYTYVLSVYLCMNAHNVILGGSWVVKSRVTIHIRGLITPLITTPKP